jgi:hypothetical protein
MKRIIALLFFAQFICFNAIMSQTSQVKQASDACPSWSKKQAKTSTDYAYLSKRSAAKDNSDFSKPKYQSIYGKNNSSYKLKNENAAALAPKEEKPKTTKKPSPVKEGKNMSSKSIREAENKNPEEQKLDSVVETKEPAAKEVIEPVKKNEASGKSASSQKEKKQINADKNSNKPVHQKTPWYKKLKFGRKNAADCPQF